MGGDHKCPLCAATFTRPQHVGRHLRAHTGDRPYECKECPLRFARSDLLSRHVSKAHPKVNGANDKNDKKPRRKANSSQPATAALKPNGIPPPSPNRPAVPVLPSPAVVIPQAPEPTAFQAQRMYPNHPLLQQNTGGWGTGYDLGSQQFSAPLGDSQHGGIDNGGYDQVSMDQGASYSHSPYTSTSMHISGSDGGASDMTSGSSSFASSLPDNYHQQHQSMGGFEPFVKKRACDQCNHSKVRCDFAEPCARCSHRSVACTYSKPQRMRTTLSAVERAPVAGTGGPTASPVFSSSYQNQDHRVSQGLGNFPDRRNSAPQSSFLTSDALLNVDVDNSGPWGTANASSSAQDLRVMTDVNGSSSSFMNQSPMNMGMALTPTLTHSGSPTTSDSTGRRPSSTSAYNLNWGIPASGDYGVGAQGQGDSKGQSEVPNHAPMLWSGVMDSNPSSQSGIHASEQDEETPPVPPRRRSSAGMWASAFNQMKLDDGSQHGLTLDANGQLQFPFLRHGTSPMDRPPMHSRQSTNHDLWKFFLNPTALATPDQKFEADSYAATLTPGGLSKSNSMPDLTTPPTGDNSMEPPAVLHSQLNAPKPGKTEAAGVYSADDGFMDRWKNHIQRRQAAFSIHLSPDKGRKIRTQAIANASFASSFGGRPVRPLPSALIPSGSLEQTLAPERLPSFGTPPVDPTTPMPGHPGYGQLGQSPLTPKNRTGGSTKMSQPYFERPVNKRQASQTLLPADGLKRVSA